MKQFVCLSARCVNFACMSQTFLYDLLGCFVDLLFISTSIRRWTLWLRILNGTSSSFAVGCNSVCHLARSLCWLSIYIFSKNSPVVGILEGTIFK